MSAVSFPTEFSKVTQRVFAPIASADAIAEPVTADGVVVGTGVAVAAPLVTSGVAVAALSHVLES